MSIPFRLEIMDELGNKLPIVGMNGVWSIIELGDVTKFIVNIYE